MSAKARRQLSFSIRVDTRQTFRKEKSNFAMCTAHRVASVRGIARAVGAKASANTTRIRSHETYSEPCGRSGARLVRVCWTKKVAPSLHSVFTRQHCSNDRPTKPQHREAINMIPGHEADQVWKEGFAKMFGIELARLLLRELKTAFLPNKKG